MKLLCFNIEYGGKNIDIGDLIKDYDVAIICESSTKSKKYKLRTSTHTQTYFPFNDTTVFTKGYVEVYKDHVVLDGIHIYPVHFHDFPYQPFQIIGTEYCEKVCQPFTRNVHEIIKSAKEARGKAFEYLKRSLEESREKGAEIIIAGDFNEPSHLDWTPRAVSHGLCPMSVVYPISYELSQLGYVDAYRQLYPDEVTHPGYTWPTSGNERKERIDFIYVSEGFVKKFKLRDYGSDHFAIKCEIEV